MKRWARRYVIAAALSLAALVPLTASGAGDIDELSDVLLLEDVIKVLRVEGLRYGEGLNEDLLSGTGGRYFSDKVERIYDPEAMLSVLEASLEKRLTPEETRAALDFFGSDAGRRILQLEISARVAMVDPAVDELADAIYAEAVADENARVDAIMNFIEINDLNERNVTGALSSNYHFFNGLVEGGSHRMSEAEILDEVWSQEDAIRADTLIWLQSFLYMAYGPLSDSEMQDYLDFSETEAGQALNGALFDGFDAMYREIYFALGLSVAEALQSSEL